MPTVLELGGKAPAIMCADAELEQAVAGVAFEAFFNQGQICMSTERVLVDARVADEFMARLVAKTRDIAVGQQEDPQTTFAYLESEQAAERLRALVEDAVQQGRSEEHTSELQSRGHLVCRLLLEKIKDVT